MQTKFVKNLSNVQRFLDGAKTLQSRGASEASVLLVKGHVGFGKSDTSEWYAVQNRALFLTAHPDWTPSWLYKELAIGLGIKARHHTKDMFDPVCDEIVKRLEREPEFCLMIDEFGFLAERGLVNSVRSVCDMTKVPLIAIGEQDIATDLRRYKAFTSRICKTVEFSPATAKDVRALCAAFTDAKIADDMVELIRRRSGGQLRGIKQAIALVDQHARRNRGEVTAADWGSRTLLPDDRDIKGDEDV